MLMTPKQTCAGTATNSLQCNVLYVEPSKDKHVDYSQRDVGAQTSREERIMIAKSVVSSKRKGIRLIERYGKIGIAAVEAAAQYQRKGDRPKSIGSAAGTKRKRERMRGTSPRK